MKSKIIAALDIGTYSFKAGVAKIREDGSLEAVGFAEEPSSGVRKGSVVKPDEAAQKIISLKQRIENLSSQKIHQVLVNVGGSHLSIISSHGIIAVSRADKQISKEDVDRVVGAAQAFSLPSNKEILEVFPQQFIVDGIECTKEIVGMKGVRLEADVLAICAFSPYIKNLNEAVLSSDLEISDSVPSPLMSESAVLTSHQKEAGVTLIDIGAGTTNMAVFQEGDLIHATVFPVGSENITNDVAIGLRTEHDIAETVKKEFGTLAASKGKRIERIELQDSSLFSFSPKILSRIVEARMREIFQFVNKELKVIDRQGLLPGGVVLVGGGAKLPKIADFAKKELKLPARVGSPHGIITFETDPVFLGVMGLLIHGSLQGGGEGFFQGNGFSVFQTVKRVFRIFIP